jgi:hypothetical protein
MDFSGLIVIPLAALITAGWIIGAALMSKRGADLRLPFILSYAVGVVLMEPWRIATWQHLGMFAVMLIMLLFSTLVGCLLGGLPATLIVWLGAKMRRRKP